MAPRWKSLLQSAKTSGFIALWLGLLVLPFMGVRRAAALTAALLIGGIFVSTWLRFVRSPSWKRLVGRWRTETRLALPFLQKRGVRRGGGTIALGLLLVLPLAMNDYYVDVLTLAGIYVVLALGLNIVVGLAGLLDLGYVAFYAVGAYTYAIVSTQWGVPFWPSLALGAFLAALLGVFLGMITLRLRGDYLAIVTLGFLMIVHLILNNWDEVTRGPNGILGIPSPSLGGWTFSQPIHFFYLILTMGVLVILVANRLNHSRIGRAWIAIREDEIAASAMGIPVTRMKILAFAMGAGMAGMA
ncbi:MAG: branched-chain amino acid ABC transporter permease, partial [Nitrospirae bacterium]|nr:branched-chain amino acid ABC transporter permease [Nitrospirota bacterium]